MKSLEIVNRERDKLKANIDLGVIQKRNVELQNIDIAKLKELDQIKQDLEVLEIIKKKKINIALLMFLIQDNDNETVLGIYNFEHHAQFKITLEELLKLRQWLEVNDNENWGRDIKRIWRVRIWSG